VVHARSLEVLEELGVAGRLNALGLKCRTFTIRDRDRTLLSLDFAALPTRYPYTLMVSQAVTEAVLLERLRVLKGDVLRPRMLVGLEQSASHVDATLDDGSQLRARYVVGADGMNSKVRELAGIGFAGGSYAESFLLADARLRGGIPRDEVILYFSPAGLVVVAPLPGGVHRIVATVDQAPESPCVDDVQALLNARGPEQNPIAVESVIWGSRFRVHHRIAEQYQAGRILLAGDAAHVHSPAGGQGMNTGIQDAVALAAAISGELEGQTPSPLMRYSLERRPVAERVISLADRLTRMATVSSQLRPFRNAALGVLAYCRPFRWGLTMRLAGLA